jgi:hypothetical protein
VLSKSLFDCLVAHLGLECRNTFLERFLRHEIDQCETCADETVASSPGKNNLS